MSKLSSIEELFPGRHFDREVIILCVRWYLRYKLSFRDLVEMMAERVLSLAHTTIMRWVSEVCLRIRQALEPLWKILWSLVASR
jgi:transposase-like protein